MKKKLSILVSLVAFFVLCSHDMFLKFDHYHFQPNTQAVLQLFNGTFEQSDNIIERNRMLDASLVGNGKRMAVDSSSWFDKNNTTFLNFKTGEAGTWVAGVSIAPRNIALKAEAFNDYLKNDGVLDILEQRTQDKVLDQDAVEQYAKHVKTIFQVGDQRSNDWNVNLGYPIEFIPLQNPYDIHTGHSLEVRLLYKGIPLQNHVVYVGTPTASKNKDHTHSHKDGESHTHTNEDGEETDHQHPATQAYTTNPDGIVRLDINATGTWYLRTIKMISATDPSLTHESNWATLTFSIQEEHHDGHTHEANTHQHEHDHGSGLHTHDGGTHSHEEHTDVGFPSYLFWIGSILVIVLLFFWFNRKK